MQSLKTKFFAYSQMHNLEIVRLGEIQKSLGLSASQERRLLERLNKSGFIFRVQRGIYIVPQKITSGGFWRPNDYLVIATYMNLHKANYYISGLAAFNKHGFSTQIPNQFIVYNDKVSGLKKFGKFTTKFIKVAKRRITAFDSLPIPPCKQTINIANLPGTILDAINDCKRYQTLPDAYLWLKKYSPNKKFLRNFIELTAKIANNNSLRRIGFYLEQLGINDKILLPIQKKIRPTQAWIALIPDHGRHGKTNKKWRIIDNAKQYSRRTSLF